MESPQSPTLVTPASPSPNKRRLEDAELESPTKKLKGGVTEEVVQLEEKGINGKEAEVNGSDKVDGECGPGDNQGKDDEEKDDEEGGNDATEPELEDKSEELQEKEKEVADEEEDEDKAKAKDAVEKQDEVAVVAETEEEQETTKVEVDTEAVASQTEVTA